MDLPSLEQLTAAGERHLPGLVGIEITGSAPGWMQGRLPVRPELFAPNGYLHAATVIALADTLCGYGSMMNLPDGAVGFTTIELKSNFVGTARDGVLAGEATLVHGGRTTQVWEALITRDQDGKAVARFGCTQLMLYPPGVA